MHINKIWFLVNGYYMSLNILIIFNIMIILPIMICSKYLISYIYLDSNILEICGDYIITLIPYVLFSLQFNSNSLKKLF